MQSKWSVFFISLIVCGGELIKKSPIKQTKQNNKWTYKQNPQIPFFWKGRGVVQSYKFFTETDTPVFWKVVYSTWSKADI